MEKEKVVLEGNISVACLIFRIILDVFLMCVVIGFVYIVKDLITFFTTKLVITNKKVTGSTGLINTNQLDSPLNKINGVQVRQGLGGKIFNYGRVTITTASSTFNFDYISDPNQFRDTLNNQIEEYDDARIKQQAKELAAAMK